MSVKVTFTSSDALSLWRGGRLLSGFELEEEIFIETWRWGNRYNIIIRDVETGKLYAELLTVQTGDNFYADWEDKTYVTFSEVKKVERTVYDYVPV